MKSNTILFILMVSFGLQGQVTLKADGPGQTYELITSVLAPGHNPIESPGEVDGSCDNHSSFGEHISEVFDADLNDNVFKFSIHISNDNDRCKNFDRQRNEIKTYDQSPDNLLGVTDEIVEYKWKFKIDNNFQSSTSFTHLHQLKAVGGTEDSMPLITLTARKASPDRLELRYAESTSQTTLTTIELSLLKGNWVEVIETVTYGENGKYQIIINNVNTGNQILNYSDNNIRMWKTQADFIRPKWGIYRSLNNSSQLRDEEVLFADFSITENSTLSILSRTINEAEVNVYPNPSRGTIRIDFPNSHKHYNLRIQDRLGKVIKNIQTSTKNIDISELPNGLYLFTFNTTQSNKLVTKKVVKIDK
ncbi:T9SS type A sorting domain-containing protein [Aquimarina sp. MMG016]|uniref:T9SS type A sorting domain-containing protein n=1 Tax=Aquimarina sp. MMG016 TaxID=2822690 RepID=UPI001B3A598B|nr:T9SS type A sorting domain-containing protein [Aquimarina sp. MMG016]MBQ4821020.1 T9SS type A sorting domain-containing protein [Aquimarina sp. MMG016]